MDEYLIVGMKCSKCGGEVHLSVEEPSAERVNIDYDEIHEDGLAHWSDCDDCKPATPQIALFCYCTVKKISGKMEVLPNR